MNCSKETRIYTECGGSQGCPSLNFPQLPAWPHEFVSNTSWRMSNHNNFWCPVCNKKWTFGGEISNYERGMSENWCRKSRLCWELSEGRLFVQKSHNDICHEKWTRKSVALETMTLNLQNSMLQRTWRQMADWIYSRTKFVQVVLAEVEVEGIICRTKFLQVVLAEVEVEGIIWTTRMLCGIVSCLAASTVGCRTNREKCTVWHWGMSCLIRKTNTK